MLDKHKNQSFTKHLLLLFFETNSSIVFRETNLLMIHHTFGLNPASSKIFKIVLLPLAKYNNPRIGI